MDNRNNKKILEKISKYITINETRNKDFKEYIVNFDELKELNEDTVAWLNVKGVNINNAVVKTTDNNYYTYHNFMKKRNDAGWLFADYRNKLDGSDKNIIILYYFN